YDPRRGRWLSRDPVGETVGTNLYSYAADSPPNLVDPLGRQNWLAGALLALQIAASSVPPLIRPELSTLTTLIKTISQTAVNAKTAQQAVSALTEALAAIKALPPVTGPGPLVGTSVSTSVSGAAGVDLIGTLAVAAGQVTALAGA